MTSNGCRRSAEPITFGTTTWPSTWWMKRKSAATQIADTGCTASAYDERRDCAEPRAEIRDQLRERDPEAEEQRVRVGARKQAGDAEHPHPDAGNRADDQRQEHLALT